MTGHQLISTLQEARTSWKLTAAHQLTARQLLFIADMLRARLLNDRRQRQPAVYEAAAQALPLLTPRRDDSGLFGVDVPASRLGPIPVPLEGQHSPGFTFIGVPGERGLQCTTLQGAFYRKASRHSSKVPTALWLPTTRELVFNERARGLPVKRLIEAVFLHPMDVHTFNPDPSAPAPLRANPLAFEYPLAGALIAPLLQMAAQHENVTTLLPADLENDDQAQPTATAAKG